MRKFVCFTSNISIQGSRPLVESGKKTIFDFPRSKWYSVPNPKVMQADPFLFVKGDTLFLFYEELLFNEEYGSIKMISTKDLVNFTNPILIIKEPDCHFSYPFVFEDSGKVYLMPETGMTNNIRLYVATNESLTDFVFDKVILERDIKMKGSLTFDFADSCIYKNDGVYYLFSSYYLDNTYYLELYFSDKMDGQYKLHPKSPIVVGNKYGRCAGSIINVDGHLLRPAQDCSVDYGEQIHLLEIDTLTPYDYMEHSYKENILPRNQKHYRYGGHHINFAQFLGKIVVSTDAKHYCTFFLERAMNKCAKLLKMMRLTSDSSK